MKYAVELGSSAERLLASQKGFSSMELVICFKPTQELNNPFHLL
jgi:hypothetical protein